MKERGEVGEVILIRGQMIDGVDLLHRTAKRILIAHITFNELDLGREILRLPFQMDGLLQVIEHAHIVAQRQQPVGGMRSDKTGTAGDKYAHQSITGNGV